MNWEITAEDILFTDKNPLKKLNALASQGWEPYAVDGITHYFKRPAEETKNALPNFEHTPPPPPPLKNKNKR